jgi:predicted transposase/invertase (TIGR01784 family)
MRTDKLTYSWFKNIPQGFFTLIEKTTLNPKNYVFQSVELKETAFRLDGVFVPNEHEEFTFFVEVQFQRDEAFYARFFAEIFLYIKQYPVQRWQAVVIYPSRKIEGENLLPFEEMLKTNLVKRIYLDELPNADRLDSSVAIFKLMIEPPDTVSETARYLIERSPQYLDFIELVLFYKFPTLTRKEILNMLNIDKELEEELRKTRGFQEILEEGRETGIKEGLERGLEQGKLMAVPLLRKLGMSDEAIAKELGLAVEKVKSA